MKGIKDKWERKLTEKKSAKNLVDSTSRFAKEGWREK